MSLPQDFPTIDKVFKISNTQQQSQNFGTLPDYTKLKDHPCNPSIQLNKIGINLLSKFTEVDQRSNTTPVFDETVCVNTTIDHTDSTVVKPTTETHVLNAFEPQHNDDFCSSDEEADSDYNPFEYPGQKL
jgi:hypothetical protein